MLRHLQILAAMLLSLSVLAGETWKITSLDWQPYSGKALPEGGAGMAVLRAALKAEGIELEVEYYPWRRALVTARKPGYAGVYPIWPEDVPEGFTGSAVLFKSPVGFVEPKDKPLRWTALDDLKGKTIGTVQGYGNTPEFMKLINNGTIRTEAVVDDLTNIKKVAAGRIDGAFIDLKNLDYLLKNDAKAVSLRIQANSKIVDTKDLLLAINNEFDNKNAVSILSSGISKIDAEQIIQDYMDKYVEQSGF